MERKSETLEGSLAVSEEVQPAVSLNGLPRSGHIPVMAVAYALGLGLFLGVEPTKPWMLLVLVGLAAIGTDGILRTHAKGDFQGLGDTAPYLFVPVLLALASGLFLEEVIDGYWTVPAVVLASGLFAVSLYAEYVSVERHGPSYPLGRFALNVLTYLSAFGFYAVVYRFDVELLPSAFAVGLVSLLLSVEIFREGEADPYRALVFAGVIGLIVAEARWSLHFIPLEGFLAGVFLLLTFYLATGVIQHYLAGTLRRSILLEFAAVTVVGLAVVIVGRALSVG
jgi:hypothetical protein